jgi:CRP/FNR family transcriptional regulator, anaerobic regulatory protein
MSSYEDRSTTDVGFDAEFQAVDPSHVCCHILGGVDCRIRPYSMCNVLDGPAIDELEALARPTTFPARQQIVVQGAPVTSVYNITEGVVRLSRVLSDGRRQIIGFLLPGDFLGVTLADASTCTADALTRVQACQFDRVQFSRFMAQQPALLRRLYILVGRELEMAQEHMSVLGRRNAEEKIASFLLGLRARRVRSAGRSDIVPLPMSRQDMADYLGLTIETVSRILRRFDREGVLDVARDKVRLLDTPMLEALIAQ